MNAARWSAGITAERNWRSRISHVESWRSTGGPKSVVTSVLSRLQWSWRSAAVTAGSLLLLACFLAPVLSCQSVSAESSARPGCGPADYCIQSGDQLDIKFFYHPELNEQLTVRPDGRISLQLTEDVLAEGLTPPQLKAELLRLYSTQLVQPEVTVILRATASRVFVDGEVVRPGPVSLASSLTLLEAVAQAGGLRESAKTKQVIIIRRGPAGKPSVINTNFSKARKAVAGQNVALQPFDIVYIPRSKISDVNLWVDQYLRKNLPVSFGLYAPVF